MTKKKVLIMSASIGSGHTQAAHAIEEYLKTLPAECEVEHFDFISNDALSIDNIVKETYLKILDLFPMLYDLMYYSSQGYKKGMVVKTLFSWGLKRRMLHVLAEKKPDMLEGILAIRHMHMRVLQETGFSTADEMLYPENLRYLSDIMSYIAVGARSVENQFHRLVASGCDVPVGLKNPTSGDLTVMLNSVVAAQVPHDFIFRGWEVQCPGNPLSHTILRGAVNKHGQTIPNYHYEDLRLLYELYMKRNLKNPACIVDTNHSNSGKQYMEQIRIAKEVLHSRRHSDDIKNLVKGLMIESYIEPGNQKIGEHCYGKSITDPCLGWDDTERLLYDIAELS